MKTNRFGLFLVLLAVFTACAAQRKTAVPVSLPELTQVTMWRTPCFGRCPTYSVEVHKEGLVRYTGIRFVKDSGVYEKNIGAARAAEFLTAFSEMRVDTLKPSYEVLISDIPGINYSFQYGGETKEVRNAHFGPKFLQRLALTLDQLVKNGDNTIVIDRSWKKISEGPKGD